MERGELAGESIQQHRRPVGHQHGVDVEVVARAMAGPPLWPQELDQSNGDAQQRQYGVDRARRRQVRHHDQLPAAPRLATSSATIATALGDATMPMWSMPSINLTPTGTAAPRTIPEYLSANISSSSDPEMIVSGLVTAAKSRR